MELTTSSVVTVLPFENSTPLRSLNRQTFASGLASQLSARFGAGNPSIPTSTMLSRMARLTTIMVVALYCVESSESIVFASFRPQRM